jgi:hypothetical protein
MKEYLGSTYILEMLLLMYFIHNKMCDEHYYEPKLWDAKRGGFSHWLLKSERDIFVSRVKLLGGSIPKAKELGWVVIGFGNVPKSWALFSIKHETKVVMNLNIQQKVRTWSKGYQEFKHMTKVFVSTP